MKDVTYRSMMKALLTEGAEGFEETVMVRVPHFPELMEFIKAIPEDYIYVDEEDDIKGREDDPHITVLYGVENGGKDQVKKLIGQIETPLSASLGVVSKFRNEKFDVLKIEVKSEDLHELNGLIKDNVNWKNSYTDYHPHVTIAYLKKGKGDEFVGDQRFVGKELAFSKILYSDKDWKKAVLKEFCQYGGSSGGYGSAGGAVAPLGAFGTFASPGVRQNPNKFAGSSTLGSREIPMNGNTVMGWAPYDSIKPEDLKEPGIDPDELFIGIKYEMSRRFDQDKDESKRIAIANIKKNPNYYSGLQMLGINRSEELPDDKVNVNEIASIIRGMTPKKQVVPDSIAEIMRNGVAQRTQGRSIESISSIMREMKKK
jgi:hypothetical protein